MKFLADSVLYFIVYFYRLYPTGDDNETFCLSEVWDPEHSKHFPVKVRFHGLLSRVVGSPSVRSREDSLRG